MKPKSIISKSDIVDTFGSECWDDIVYAFDGLDTVKDILEAMQDYYLEDTVSKNKLAHSILHWLEKEGDE